MIRHKLLSQAGSVLLQALMGLAFIGLISYAVMSYQTHTTSENRLQFAQNEIDSAAQVLSSLAAVPALCNSNLRLRNNFVRPVPITGVAVDQDIAVSIGTPTTARPGWVTATMAPMHATSIPGTITAFDLQIDRAVISGARFVRNTAGLNELWTGEIVISVQKDNLLGLPSITGKRVVGTIELEIDAAGVKQNCSTSTSVASVCRDLGGVYDALGVPSCLFALPPMDCSHLVDGYVHDVVGGVPTCRSARFVCPAGFFAAGITNGDLECVRLSRRVVYSSGPPPANCGSTTLNWTVGANTCSGMIMATNHSLSNPVTDAVTDPSVGAANFTCNNGTYTENAGSTCAPGALCTGGATTTVSSVPASPPGCYCAAGQMWDGSNCVPAAGCTPGSPGHWVDMGSGGPFGGPPYCGFGAQVGNACTTGCSSLCMPSDGISLNWICMACPAGTSPTGLGGPMQVQRVNNTWHPSICKCNLAGQTWTLANGCM